MQKLSTRRVVRNRIREVVSSRLVWIWEIDGRYYCVLDEVGKIVLEQKLPTTPEAMKRIFERCRVAGSHWRPAHILLGSAGC